jgi:small subunit ribosomal protein S20
LLENAMGQPAINGGIPEIQPHQHLICPLGGRFIAWIEGRKPLTVRGPPSIRPPMAAGAIPPPLFFELGRMRAKCSGSGIFKRTNSKTYQRRSWRSAARSRPVRDRILSKDFENMANTTSARKATRKIARRTVINKSRRTQMRSSVRSVEEAIQRGDRDGALKAMARAEPELMKAAQHNIIHKNNASRKVSRLSHQIAKLAK